MNGFTNVTPTSGQVVTTSQAKKKCDIAESVTGHDSELDRLISTATADFFNKTERQLLQSTDDYIIDDFPDSSGPIYIPKIPLQSGGVTSIKYDDTDGTEQTLASSKYVVSVHTEPGRITLDKDESDWPDTVEECDAVTIRVVTGYTSVANIPDEYKEWILLRVRELFKGEPMPEFAETLLNKPGTAYMTYG